MAISLKKKELEDYKSVVVYSAVGLGTIISGWLLGRMLFRDAREHYYANRSLEDSDPATFARQLQMAFENDNWAGWGTDEKQVFDVFNRIPSKAFYNKVQRAYRGLYNKDLTSELQKELSTSEYNRIVTILSTKR